MNRTDLPTEIGTKVTNLHVPKRGIQSFLAFSGTLIAYYCSDPEQERNRWTNLYIFVTDSGKYVGISIGCTIIPHESDFVDCKVAESLEGLISFFTVEGRRTGPSLRLFEQVISMMKSGVEHV